jgi:hypothetical protein
VFGAIVGPAIVVSDGAKSRVFTEAGRAVPDTVD